MAKMTFKLPDEMLAKMSSLGSNYDRIMGEVLKEGAEPLKEQAKQSLSSVIGNGTKEPSRSTGELLASLEVTRPYQMGDGSWNIKVGCVGRDKKGVSNATKSAILEHGKSGQPAKPWVKPAINRAKKNCIKKMQETLDREVEKL